MSYILANDFYRGRAAVLAVSTIEKGKARDIIEEWVGIEDLMKLFNATFDAFGDDDSINAAAVVGMIRSFTDFS